MFQQIRRYLIAGLIVWLPIWVTFIVIKFMVEILDGTMKLLPKHYQPDALLGVHIPGLGVLVSVVVVLLTGMLVSNFLGRHLVTFWESIIHRVPLASTIYRGVKQILVSIFSSGGKAFRQVLLVEYPRKGIWSIGFFNRNRFLRIKNQN